MAAYAVRDAIARGTLDLKDVRLLVAATSQGDLPLPGFASMVHGELDMPPCEIATLHGICASSVVALRHAALAVKAGRGAERGLRGERVRQPAAEGRRASRRRATATESGSRSKRSSCAGCSPTAPVRFCSATRLHRAGISLEVETIALKSYASQFPPCMFVGNRDEVLASPQVGWLDHPDYETRLRGRRDQPAPEHRTCSPDVVRICVNGVFELIEEGKLNPKEIDWWVTHYSSHLFREQARELFVRGGLAIDEDRVFTNLYTTGNVGAASFPLMLGDLFRSGKLLPGERILCIVPESGRFLFGYVVLRVVGQRSAATSPDRGRAERRPNRRTSRRAARRWKNRSCGSSPACGPTFETRLNRVPIVAKMYDGRMTLQDYRDLLFNLRQQVIDGSRWISRAASNVTREHFPIRSAFIGHSRDEHRDFEMIERDYASVGGNIEDIRRGAKNIGSTALSEYILSRASRENPFDLIGAMFIIEGLGRRVAARWAERIREQLNLEPQQVSFLPYHSASDDIHFERLDAAVQSGILTEKLVEEIVTAAKVVARLYVLQLEEIGNF